MRKRAIIFQIEEGAQQYFKISHVKSQNDQHEKAVEIDDKEGTKGEKKYTYSC